MNILLITPSFLPQIGGLEIAVHNLANAWIDLGHSVLVANLLSSHPVHPEAKYKVTKIKAFRGGDRFGWHKFPWNALMQRQLKKTIHSYCPDYISGHFAYPVGIWLGNLSPAIPWSITCHARDIQVLPEENYGYRLQFDLDTILSKTLKKATKVIVLSQDIKRIVTEELDVPECHVSIIPNGADIRFKTYKVSLEVKRKFKIPTGANYILSVGTNYIAKAFEIALEAFSKIAPNFPDTYYLFLGKNTSNLINIAHNLGIKDRIRTCERLEGKDLWAVFQQASLFVSSSRIEGFPVVGAEAVMAGLPLVMTDCSGNRDVILDGENGLLCRVDDADDMAEKIAFLLSNRKIRMKFSDRSRELSFNYEWNRIARNYLESIGFNELNN